MTRLHDPFLKFHEITKQRPNEFPETIHQLVANQERMLDKYDYLPERGEKACGWIERFCVIPSGENAGKPLTLLFWQKWLIYSIFSFYGNFEVEDFDHETGEIIGKKNQYVRVVNDVMLVIATGNAKTALLAAINAYILYSPEFSDPHIFIGSNTRFQSRNCFDMTMKIIERNKQLLRIANLRPSFNEILIKRKNDSSKLVAMSSNGSGYEGIIPAVIILDEIHEFKTSKYADDLRKSGKRDDLLIVEATTMGTVRGGYLDRRIELARSILSGNASESDDRKLFVIFEQESIEEIFEAYEADNISVLKKSNPSLGIAVSAIKVKEKVRDMINDERNRVSTLTKNFNIPQNPESAFFTERECRAKRFNENVFLNAPVFFGFDMAHLRNPDNDLPALTMLIVDPVTEKEYSKDFYFIPAQYEKVETVDGKVIVRLEDMVAEKSRVDTNILYNKKKREFGYQMYAERGDVVILDDELKQTLAQFGDFSTNGITEKFILAFLGLLELRLGVITCKFGLDPNKATEIESFINSNIASIDGLPPAIQFRMEQKKYSNPIIFDTKDARARGLVYNNNRLTELHFAAAEAKEDAHGYITITNPRLSRKDGVISHLAARSAYNVFTTNAKTGEANLERIKMWWNENRQRIEGLCEDGSEQSINLLLGSQ